MGKHRKLFIKEACGDHVTQRTLSEEDIISFAKHLTHHSLKRHIVYETIQNSI